MVPQKSVNKKKNSKSLVDKQRFSRSGLSIFVVIFAAVGGYLLWLTFAATPTAPNVYLSPSTSVGGTNTTFTVQIRENSGATAVSVVDATFTYPASLVDCVSIDTSASPFSKVPTDPSNTACTSGSGFVTVNRGVPPNTSKTGDQLVGVITFKTKTTGGAAAMAFATGTDLIDANTTLDILGSLANTTGATFTIDTLPPTVSLTAPANNATLSGASSTPITISATASDASSTVSKVEFYNGATLLGTVSTPPYNFSWNVSAASTLGAHSLTAKAYDTQNNSASSTAVNVTLTDQTAPSAPTALHTTLLTLTAANLAWTASTDNIGVTSYKLKKGGVLIATITPPTLSYNDTTLSANTPYVYTLQATDAAGNLSATTSLNVTTPSKIAGDITGDGHVDSTDLTFMIANYNTVYPAADFNNSGKVDGSDFAALLKAYGT